MTQEEYAALGDLPPFKNRDAISRSTELTNLAHILRHKPFPLDCPIQKIKDVIAELESIAEWLVMPDGAIWSEDANRVYETALKIKSVRLDTDTIRDYVSVMPL